MTPRLAATLLCGAALAARADDLPRLPPPPVVAQECGACHLAFPPGALPAASWHRLMAGLGRHFGTDASIDDPATLASVRDWLVAHAATGRRAQRAPPQDRITRADWFVHEHDELPPAAWQQPAVKTAANCPACHAGAAQGRFDEHEVRVPR